MIMEAVTQVAIGVGLGVLANRIMSTRKSEMTPNRSRRKKFVRVRGHMRCMPKKCKCEQEVTPVEKKQEESALSSNEIREREIPKTLIESAPFRAEDWPTMSDVTKEPSKLDEEKIDPRAIPWKKVALIGGILLVAIYISKQAQTAPGAK